MDLHEYRTSGASDRFHGEFSDPPVFAWCGGCEGAICVGEEYFETPDETKYCGECVTKKTADKPI